MVFEKGKTQVDKKRLWAAF